MTPLPGLRELMRAGVRRSVAAEYRRLLAAGVSGGAAVVLARGRLSTPVDASVDKPGRGATPRPRV
jgi:hypothetical protein